MQTPSNQPERVRIRRFYLPRKNLRRIAPILLMLLVVIVPQDLTPRHLLDHALRFSVGSAAAFWAIWASHRLARSLLWWSKRQ